MHKKLICIRCLHPIKIGSCDILGCPCSCKIGQCEFDNDVQ